VCLEGKKIRRYRRLHAGLRELRTIVSEVRQRASKLILCKAVGVGFYIKLVRIGGLRISLLLWASGR